jgi:pyruvate/2-oxoglutarate dehydrogenase complex dihydrolipoamide dehydrogenase (E3) component
VTAADGQVQTLSTRAIVIATGARPTVPPLPGLEAAGHVTSDTLWQLKDLPPRLVVLGGGPIGCELAQAFARLGSAVTLVEMAPRLMLREDEEVSAAVAAALQADGVRLCLQHAALRCEGRAAQGDSRLVVKDAQGAEHTLPYDTLLVAVGRSARLEGYGLQELGLPTGRTLEVDEYLQTRFPHILAAGDVAGPYQFTHTAAHQAWYAAVNGLFGFAWRFKADYRVIPAVTYVAPEVARVGLNEQEARAQQVPCEVTHFELGELDRVIIEHARGPGTAGWVKVLTPPGKDRILGVTVVGEQAGELLAEWVLAMKHGLGLNQVLGTVHAYPTRAESSKYAAGVWKRAHQPVSLLRWVERLHAWRRG